MQAARVSGRAHLNRHDFPQGVDAAIFREPNGTSVRGLDRLRRNRVRRSRLVFLLGMLLVLTVCYLVAMVVSGYQPPSTKAVPLWMTREEFYQYIERNPIALPDGKSLTLHREQIESLSIEPGGEAPESDAAEVSFVVRTDRGRYRMHGLMSLHINDIYKSTIVNLGRDWDVTKE